MTSVGINMLTNGNFNSPSLGVNTLSRMGQGGSITGWIYVNAFQIALCNGILDSLGYRKTTTSQFVFMTGIQNISQTINITQTGTYYFSMEYCKPTTYNSNKYVISIDGVILASTPSSYGLSWTTLYAQVQILTTGNKVFKIEGTTSGAQGAFTNLNFYYAGG